VDKPEYDSQITDDEKIDIGSHVLKIDKYLFLYRELIKRENKINKNEMIYLYQKTTAATAAAATAAAAAAAAATFEPHQRLIALKFRHDFLEITNDKETKLIYNIQKRTKKISQELNTGDMLKDYVKSRISDLLTNRVGKINIKPIADEIKKMSEEIRDLIPRTKSEHVGISMHKIRGGNQNRILWKNMFNKYNRNDLNLISKHYGLKNIEKVKNKRTIINNLNAIILYRSGNFNKRKDLNSFSKLFGINPKLYKRKKDLIHKLNQTIS